MKNISITLFILLVLSSNVSALHNAGHHGVIYTNICEPGIDNAITEWSVLADPSDPSSGSVIINWMPLAGAALFVSVVILVFLYMFGVLTRNQNAMTFVKFELYECLATFVILMIVISWVTMTCSLNVSSFLVFNPAATAPVDPFSGVIHSHVPQMDIFSAGEKYFEQVSSTMSGWMQTNYLFAIWLDEAASITPYTRPLGVGMVAAPLAGLAAPLKQVVYNIFTALSVAYIINYGQLHVFVFSIVAFIKFYFPIGIFLRAFTPTRRIGGTLLGIGLGFLFIMPLLTILSYIMFVGQGAVLSLFNNAIEEYMFRNINVQALIGHIASSFFDVGVGTILGGFIAGKWGALLGFIIGFGGLPGSVLTGAFLIPSATIGTAFLIGFIVPVLNTLVLVHAIKSLAQALGEEVDITSLTRMI